jgi:hypothetical protein
LDTYPVALIPEVNHHVVKQAVERDSDLEVPKRKSMEKQKPNRHTNKRHSNNYDGPKMDHINPNINNRPGLK